jgi:imidazolonepropionase-like amidohydrolase
MIRFFVTLVTALSFAAAMASDQMPGAAQSEPIALVGGTVHAVSGDDIVQGTVLFEGGIITAVGTDVAIPEGARIVDVSGRHVYPGMLNAESLIGLREISAVRASRDHQEVGDLKPEVRADLAVNPDSELFPVARIDGILAALVMPTGGLVPGRASIVYFDGWTIEDMRISGAAGLMVNWPSMSVDRAGDKAEEALKARDERLARLREFFAQARAYWKARDAGGDEGVPYQDVDNRMEAMGPVLDGDLPVIVVANDVRQIQATLDWAETEGVRIIIMGGHDAGMVAGELAARDVPVIYSTTFRLPPRRHDPYDALYSAPARLHEAGARFCIATTFGPADERVLPSEAARASAHGLPRQEALKAVTLYAAQILGVDDRLGSLEVGKHASLVVTDGDLLEMTTRIEQAFIQGREVDLTSRQTQLYDKYRIKYERMGLLAP